jgi:hypothetical protein
MKTCRIICSILLLATIVSAQPAEPAKKGGVKITDNNFRKISTTFLNDPANKIASSWSRLIVLYVLESKNVEVVLGREEWTWTGLESEHPYAPLLLAGYTSGNILSQMNSGVKRNDRYSGLLTLFRVYRTLRETDEEFKPLDAVEQLLKLHRENKLTAHLQELDKKKPEKLSPADEAVIRNLIKIR